jgi:hypothetical protein
MTRQPHYRRRIRVLSICSDVILKFKRASNDTHHRTWLFAHENISSNPKKSGLDSTFKAENTKRPNTGRLGVLRPDLGLQEVTTKGRDQTKRAGEILKGGGWVMDFRLRERKMGEWGKLIEYGGSVQLEGAMLWKCENLCKFSASNCLTLPFT